MTTPPPASSSLLTSPLLTSAGFRNRAAERLHGAPPPSWHGLPDAPSKGPSDYDLDPDALADLATLEVLRPAAVLVPVVMRAELTVLLTKRTAHLTRHPGQIAFPGGRVDPEDPGPLHTALRESHEEIGLARADVEPLGYLDAYRTGTGYRIQPVVALVSPHIELALNPHEVDEAFEVPLSFLMDTANHQRHSREWKGRMRQYYAMPFEDRYIWGATAGILRNLHQRMFTE